jgi:hypothetical protein
MHKTSNMNRLFGAVDTAVFRLSCEVDQFIEFSHYIKSQSRAMELFVPGTPDKVKKVSYDIQKELNTHTTFVLLIEKTDYTAQHGCNNVTAYNFSSF